MNVYRANKDKKVNEAKLKYLPKTLNISLVLLLITRTSLLFSDFKNTLESERKNPLGK